MTKISTATYNSLTVDKFDKFLHEMLLSDKRKRKKEGFFIEANEYEQIINYKR